MDKVFSMPQSLHAQINVRKLNNCKTKRKGKGYERKLNVCVYSLVEVYLNKELVECLYEHKKIKKEQVVKQIMCFSFAFLIKNCVSVFYIMGCVFHLSMAKVATVEREIYIR